MCECSDPKPFNCFVTTITHSLSQIQLSGVSHGQPQAVLSVQYPENKPQELHFFPTEVLRMIFTHLHNPAAICLALTCKKLHRVYKMDPRDPIDLKYASMELELHNMRTLPGNLLDSSSLRTAWKLDGTKLHLLPQNWQISEPKGL